LLFNVIINKGAGQNAPPEEDPLQRRAGASGGKMII